MDYQKWKELDWSTEENWSVFEKEAWTDAEIQLSAQGLKLLKTLPGRFSVGIVASTEDEQRFIHITVKDVREENWFDNVRLRRMSSPRDWKGNEFHYCSWNEIGEKALKYLAPEYDDEAL